MHLGESNGDDYLVKTPASQPEPPAIVDWKSPTPKFLLKNGYQDTESSSFGRHEWSGKLGRYEHNSGTVMCQRPFGWLALIAEPVADEPLAVDLGTLAKSLPKDVSSTEDQRRFVYPTQAVTTANSLILFEHDYLSGPTTGDCWPRFVRIEKSGAVEHCDYRHVAGHWTSNTAGERSIPIFMYVQIIGTIWTFLIALKRLFTAIGHVGGVRFYVNLIGTKDTVLIDFAYGQGPDRKSWLDPFNPDIFGIGDFFSRLRCRDVNLQFSFKLVIGSLNDMEIMKIVRSCANQFGLAYNHQSEPRCFVHGTEEFPWPQFAGRRY